MRSPEHRTSALRRRAAGLLRSLAGMPLGLGRARRRGSALVLIVSALAVLSVVVIGYWAIGRGDRQTGGTIIRADQVEDRIVSIRDYFRGVVARDVTSVSAEGYDSNTGDPLVLSEQTDFPFTDWDRRNTIDTNWSAEEQDRRRFDPAGTLPRSWSPDGRTILPFPPSDPWLASTQPSWVNFNILGTGADKVNQKRDWWQVSNFAPDGRFVNLWNLAPVSGGVRTPNFDAESGVSANLPSVTPRISDNLFLLNPVDGSATQSLDFTPAGPFTLEDLHETPAAWGMRQVGAYRPALEVQHGPDNPRYAHYMWADTDGDGFFDARWFELVDASLPNPGDPGRRLAISVLPPDGRHRWFVAARAIDLSALANVNTGSFVSPNLLSGQDPPYEPTDIYRAGVTPGDVDIRRLLTLEDALMDLGLDGYVDLRQPASGPARAEDYSRYDYLREGHRVGHEAYHGVLFTQRTLRPIGPGPFQVDFVPPDATERQALFFRAAAQGLETVGALGVGDLVELLTYHGANDPAVTSRLEQAIGGHESNNLTYSPLRDNRPLELERDYVFDLDPSRAQVDANGQLLDWPAGINSAAIVQASADVRRNLTTLSGARPMQSGRVPYLGNPDDPDRFEKIGDPRNRFSRDPDPQIAKQQVLAEMLGDLTLRRAQDRVLPDFDDRLYDPVASNSAEWQVYRTDANGVPILSSAPPQPPSTARVSARDALDFTIRCVDPVSGAQVVGPVESCQMLFAAYAEALLPCSGDGDAWDPNAGNYDAMRTTFYGNDPFAAVKAAAHMAVNARDMYDDRDVVNTGSDSPPGAATVVFTRPAESGQGPALNVTHKNSVLTLPAGRGIPGPPHPSPTSPAIDIYGVEAQPFLTEAASFVIYTDHPHDGGWAGKGADEDGTYGGDPGAIPPIDPVTVPITIDGTVSADAGTGNKDFIGQVLVVQLHNPFDESVDLAGYSLEFGGHTYDLTGTMSAGATSPVIATYPSVSEITSRLQGANSPCSPTSAASFGTWLTRQANNSAANFEETSDLLAGTPGMDAEENRVALLWRTWRVNDRSGQRDVKMLADRLRDPTATGTRPTLDRRMDSVSEEIGQAMMGEECQPDNRGLSITYWGSIRRPDDEAGQFGNPVPLGALPAWCLERKDRGDGVQSLNAAATDGRNPTSPDLGDFQGRPEGGDSLAALLGNQNNNDLVPTIKQEPKDKQGNALTTAAHLPRNPSERRPGRDVRLPFSQLYAEIHLDNNEFRRTDSAGNRVSVLRPADMLMALAVGPEYDSYSDDVTNIVGDERWTTLSEAMAKALGYDDEPPPPSGERAADLYEITDGGHLRLDDFAPFVDLADNSVVGPMLFDAGLDERRASGIPLALNVLDQFTVHGGGAAALSVPVPGLVNICTAPLPVLRTLPMLSPPVTADPTNYYAPGQWWWNDGTHDSTSDISSTVLAYRDRIAISPRFETSLLDFTEPALRVPGYSGDPSVVSYTFYSEPWLGRGTPAQPDPANPTSPTEINGLRELPGFAALGELLAVRDLRFVGGSGGNPTVPSPMDMDRLGFDQENVNRDGSTGGGVGGVDSFLYRSNARHDELIDEFDEKLAIVNAAAASASVRSDYFAVWFVVHGYQRSDVEGLRPSDAIRPSIARRFLMILDRSNVVREGDLPRMVVFKELPL